MAKLEYSPEIVRTIVQNPEAYGFSWNMGSVNKDGIKLDGVPLVKHNDTKLLEAHFGSDFILGSLDGTSRHVTNQGIVRDARWANRKISVDALKVLIVESMLGKRASRKGIVVDRPRWTALDGSEFDTKQELMDYLALQQAENLNASTAEMDGTAEPE